MVIKINGEELDLDKMTVKELKNQELRFSNYIWQCEDIIKDIEWRLKKKGRDLYDYDGTVKELQETEKLQLEYSKVLGKIREKIKEKRKEEREESNKR